MASHQKAAGLRRSALAERMRLQAEWAELKGDTTSEVLRGVVALVEVGEGSKALALRSALTALGATVVPHWVPVVTHVVWAAGGCRKTRAKARALACRVVSPLWVEACAASARRLTEHAFPSAVRPSDLPSPRTLTRMLKIAEKENIPLDLLSNSTLKPVSQTKHIKLRISSDHESSANKSADKSADTSTDQSADTSADSPNLPSRVNTAPRRALPLSIGTPVPAVKSRRKLFTHKEAAEGDASKSDDENDTRPPPVRPKKPTSVKITQRDRRDLARAERMARRLANAGTPAKTPAYTQSSVNIKPRIVLTGMSSTDRREIFDSIRKLNGKVQTHVNKRTSHIILGTCCENNDGIDETANTVRKNKFGAVTAHEITGIGTLPTDPINTKTPKRIETTKPRTLNALEGAARGCRVLAPQWARDCAAAGRWLHPQGYEVPHLRKLSQRARIERSAVCKIRSEYAYDIFCGLAVTVTSDAEQKDAATKLLTLCGAKLVHDTAPDVTVGKQNGQISSKWVFDSVAAARVRSTRRYLVKNDENVVAVVGESNDVFASVESR